MRNTLADRDPSTIVRFEEEAGAYALAVIAVSVFADVQPQAREEVSHLINLAASLPKART